MSAQSTAPAQAKRRSRTPADSAAIPAVPPPTRTPALTTEQLHVLHGVYRIILAHRQGAA